jgi:hypothetical protein
VSRRVFRYAPYTVEQDGTAEATYEAECVSGDVIECGAESGPHHDPQPVEEWMRRHTQDAGHRRFLRIFSDYAVLRPPAEPAGLAQANGGTA